jgi:hypothetical protein
MGGRKGTVFCKSYAACPNRRGYDSVPRQARLLRRAISNVRELRWCRLPFTRASAELVRAGVALLREQHSKALRFESGAQMLEASQSNLFAAGARYCVGALLPYRARGSALQAAATAVLAREGVAEPLRWMAWSIPALRATGGISYA